MDLGTLFDTVIAAATACSPTVHSLGVIAGTEVVKEETKAAYKALKGKIGVVLGRKAERAVDKVGEDPTSEQAKEALALALTGLDPQDLPEVEEQCVAMLAAMKDDAVAMRASEAGAGIKLDIESGGHVRLIDLKGAGAIDVKSKSTGDFELRDVDMDRGPSRGN